MSKSRRCREPFPANQLLGFSFQVPTAAWTTAGPLAKGLNPARSPGIRSPKTEGIQLMGEASVRKAAGPWRCRSLSRPVVISQTFPVDAARLGPAVPAPLISPAPARHQRAVEQVRSSFLVPRQTAKNLAFSFIPTMWGREPVSQRAYHRNLPTTGPGPVRKPNQDMNPRLPPRPKASPSWPCPAMAARPFPRPRHPGRDPAGPRSFFRVHACRIGR